MKPGTKHTEASKRQIATSVKCVIAGRRDREAEAAILAWFNGTPEGQRSLAKQVARDQARQTAELVKRLDEIDPDGRVRKSVEKQRADIEARARAMTLPPQALPISVDSHMQVNP